MGETCSGKSCLFLERKRTLNFVKSVVIRCNKYNSACFVEITQKRPSGGLISFGERSFPKVEKKSSRNCAKDAQKRTHVDERKTTGAGAESRKWRFRAFCWLAACLFFSFATLRYLVLLFCPFFLFAFLRA